MWEAGTRRPLSQIREDAGKGLSDASRMRRQRATPLAMTVVDRYCAAMPFGKIRRISAALMAIVLAIGLSTHGLGGPNMITTSAMALASDMPMSGDLPGKCDGCAGDEKGLAPALCSAFCGTVMPSPVMTVLYVVPAEILTPAAERIAIGRAEPPDPYPPRSIVLS